MKKYIKRENFFKQKTKLEQEFWRMFWGSIKINKTSPESLEKLLESIPEGTGGVPLKAAIKYDEEF